MDITPLLETVTPLGLVALMIVLGYYAINKISQVQSDHYERQTQLLNQLNLTMIKCAERLNDIEESLKNPQ